jgi:hypothetical protein
MPDLNDYFPNPIGTCPDCGHLVYPADVDKHKKSYCIRYGGNGTFLHARVCGGVVDGQLAWYRANFVKAEIVAVTEKV